MNILFGNLFMNILFGNPVMNILFGNPFMNVLFGNPFMRKCRQMSTALQSVTQLVDFGGPCYPIWWPPQVLGPSKIVSSHSQTSQKNICFDTLPLDQDGLKSFGASVTGCPQERYTVCLRSVGRSKFDPIYILNCDRRSQ